MQPPPEHATMNVMYTKGAHVDGLGSKSQAECKMCARSGINAAPLPVSCKYLPR